MRLPGFFGNDYTGRGNNHPAMLYSMSSGMVLYSRAMADSYGTKLQKVGQTTATEAHGRNTADEVGSQADSG